MHLSFQLQEKHKQEGSNLAPSRQKCKLLWETLSQKQPRQKGLGKPGTDGSHLQS
jgi:hypothetical protein